MLKLATVFGILAIAVYYYYVTSPKVFLPSPIVMTRNGLVQGIQTLSRDGRVFYEYFGLPYARPPLGHLRFESPQPLTEKWSGIRDASKFGNECLQLHFIRKYKPKMGSEDCLFLNVFTTNPLPENKNEKEAGNLKLRPVFVWIHGGIFVFGSANMYRGDYFADEDVVVVTLNYRLASLGFLNTGDGIVRGNMGLKDQTMALRWVQDNIEEFGGDPKNVILIGESAGAASVHHHVVSPLSRGLFAKAIIESGTAVSAWATRNNPERQAQRFARNVNCPIESNHDMVACLKKLTSDQILDGHMESLENIKEPDTLFGPSVEIIKDDQAFIIEHPSTLTKLGQTHNIPIIFGYNSHEGLLTSPGIVRDDVILNRFDQEFNELVGNLLFIPSTEDPKANSLMSKARDFYFGPGEKINTFDKFENYTNIVSDYSFAVGIHYVGKHLQKIHQHPVYFYYYSYKGKFTLTNMLLALRGQYPQAIEFLIFKIQKWYRETILRQEPIHYGTCHGDELPMLFKLDGMYDIGHDHPDYAMSKSIIKLWVDFALNSDHLTYKGVEWNSIQKDTTSLKYLQIDAKGVGMIKQPDMKRLDFWEPYFPWNTTTVI